MRKSRRALVCSGGIFDWDKANARLLELNNKAEDPEVWNKPEKARDIMRERDHLQFSLDSVRKIEADLKDQIELIELGEAEGDANLVLDAENIIAILAEKAARMKLESLLSGEADANNAFVEFHPGAGGTESHDWANMLFRMYLRWAEQRGFKTEILEILEGEETGIKSATIRIIGHNAYGWLKTEAGVHRLVRISPFDSNARRHTSFASVWVYPGN